MTNTKKIGNAGAPLGCGNQADATGKTVLNVRTFNFMGTDVRVAMKNGDPWFVASDVCDVLGPQNPTKSISSLDEDERSNFKLGRRGDANTISEAGLYTLIMRSRKPQAKPFRRWVTHEVLPTINRTGTYTKPQAAKTLTEPTMDPLIIGSMASAVVEQATSILRIDVMHGAVTSLGYRVGELEKRIDAVAPVARVFMDKKNLIIPLELIRR